ncbi:replication factor A protein 3-domain-containing protein [Xylaria sp. CBS 124048]|nr:replication factor A protein 3-domain-containing protein [Xylaria sp. CBS 124048]
MDAVSTPRISANMLDAYVGQNVIVVGKVLQLRGESAVLDANGQVNAILNRESHLMAGNGAQIIGRVNPDLSVKVYNAMDLGSEVDFNVAQSVVEATHQHKKLFVYDNAGATAASYCSSSSVVYSSSSFSDDEEFIQLATQHSIPPSSQLITAQSTRSSRLSNNFQSTSPNRPTTSDSYCSSSSEVYSASWASDNEGSQRAAIGHHQPSPSLQLVTDEDYHSSPSEDNSPIPSFLGYRLSRLSIRQNRGSSSRPPTAESHDLSPPGPAGVFPPRPATSESYCSSSSEVLSSRSVSPDGDSPLFAPAARRPFSPGFINHGTSSFHIEEPQSTIPSSSSSSQFSDPLSPTTPIHERGAPWRIHDSPSSTGKLSNSYSSPAHSPPRPRPSSSAARSPRLYRTRSGNLASITELRERRERDQELLDVVLRGIKVLREAATTPLRRSIAMSLDENGRWRIHSIREPWGP